MTFEADEHPRRATSIEKLAGLPAAAPGDRGLQHHRRQRRRPQRRRGGAGRDLGRRSPTERGLTPLAVVRSWASVGVDPADTGLAPSRPRSARRSTGPGSRSTTSTCSRSTRRSPSVPVAAVKVARPRPGEGQPVRQRLQPRSPDRRHRRPHARRRWSTSCAVAAAASGRRDVRRRRHGQPPSSSRLADRHHLASDDGRGDVVGASAPAAPPRGVRRAGRGPPVHLARSDVPGRRGCRASRGTARELSTRRASPPQRAPPFSLCDA